MLEVVCIAFSVLALAPVTFVYGLAAVISGRIQLSRSRVLTGDSARLAGSLCIVLSIAYLYYIWVMGHYLPQ